jgi:hypothetical protein
MEAVEAAVSNATPEQLAEVKKVEADFKVQHEISLTWIWSRSHLPIGTAHVAATPASKI